jgi:hypothetical protein
MLSALGLSLGQLADRRILRVLGKSALVTLALFVVLGAGLVGPRHGVHRIRPARRSGQRRADPARADRG